MSEGSPCNALSHAQVPDILSPHAVNWDAQVPLQGEEGRYITKDTLCKEMQANNMHQPECLRAFRNSNICLNGSKTVFCRAGVRYFWHHTLSYLKDSNRCACQKLGTTLICADATQFRTLHLFSHHQSQDP